MYGHFLFRYVISIKLMILKILKISTTIVTFLNLGNLEASSEETMELRELINKSNENLGPYLFGGFNLSFVIFRPQELTVAQKPRCPLSRGCGD